MTTKAKGTSVRQKITDLATKLDVPFQNIQTAFMIERLVWTVSPIYTIIKRCPIQFLKTRVL